MNKERIRAIAAVLALLLPLAATAEGEIYRVVDKDGNVTFTDQRPSDAAQPMDLPPLSVIESAIEEPASEPQTPLSAEGGPQEPSPQELRRQFGDFRITQPAQEETFWGTDNTVVVAWGSSQPPLPGMAARLYVDGTPQDVAAAGNVSLTLDRGEHQVYAELLGPNGRRIATSETVTFFVHQYSANFGGAASSPRN